MWIDNNELKVWNIIKQYPEELGIILESKNYLDYASTFYIIGIDSGPEITEEQFNLVKDFFNNKNNINLNNDMETKDLYSDIICPYCGAKHFEEKMTIQTLAYAPKIFKDGKLVQPNNSNISITHFHCLECGHGFESRNGKIEKIENIITLQGD